MKKFLLLFTSVFCCLSFAQAQRAITGKVTAKDGEALVGVSIVLKGTTTGAVSDVDGVIRFRCQKGRRA